MLKVHSIVVYKELVKTLSGIISVLNMFPQLNQFTMREFYWGKNVGIFYPALLRTLRVTPGVVKGEIPKYYIRNFQFKWGGGSIVYSFPK